MTTRSVTHATFTIERIYDAAPARVFAAWADPKEKARWSDCHDNQAHGEFDFCVGGRETSRGGPPGGPVYTVDARYQDIVANQRIVFSYEMQRDGTRISVSLVTIELRPAGPGTHLLFTEQGAFLDGGDTPAEREHGTAYGLDKLGEALRRVSVSV
jgi:uncharacterized protein YndB with AHSA1/START domain